MTEHEQFKNMCEDIGYSPKFYWDEENKTYWKDFSDLIEGDLREIIFLPCFKNTFTKYLY